MGRAEGNIDPGLEQCLFVLQRYPRLPCGLPGRGWHQLHQSHGPGLRAGHGVKGTLLAGNGQHPWVIKLVFAGMEAEQVGIRGREAQLQVIPKRCTGSRHNGLMMPLPLVRQVRYQLFLRVSQAWGNPVQFHLCVVVAFMLQPFADPLQPGERLLQTLQILLAHSTLLMVKLERLALEIGHQEGVKVALLTQSLKRWCLELVGRFFRQRFARQRKALFLRLEHGHLAPVAPAAVLAQLTGQTGNVSQYLLPVLLSQSHSDPPFGDLGILEIRIDGGNDLLDIGDVVFCRPDAHTLVDT